MGPWLVPNGVRSLGAVAWCVVMLVAGDGIGYALFGLVARSRTGNWVRWTLPLAGYALISLGILGLSAVGLVSTEVVLALAIALAMIALWWVGRSAGRIAVRTHGLAAEAPWVAIALAAVVVISLPRLVLPEHNEDCLMYHLALPQELMKLHKLPEPPCDRIWTIPLLADFPNVFAVRLGIDAAARLVELGIMWLGAAACVGALAGAIRGGWALLLALPAILIPSGTWFLLTAKNDTGSAGYLLAGIAVLVEAGGRRAALTAFGAGMLGCAAAVKYTLAPIAFLAAALLVRPREWARARAGGWVAVAAAPVVPWLAISWLRYADPISPVGALIWPGVLGEARSAVGVVAAEEGPRTRMLPAAAKLGKLIAFSGWPAVASILPWVLMRGFPALAGAVAAVAGTWLLMSFAPKGDVHMVRYSFPALVLLNSIGMAGFARLAGGWGRPGGRRWARPVLAFLAVGVAILVLNLEWRIRPIVTWKEDGIEARGRDYLAGRMGAVEYRRGLMGSYGKILPVLEDAAKAGPGSRLLCVCGKFLWDIPVPVLGIGEPVVWDAVNRAATPNRVAVGLRQLGVRWILFDSDVGAWDRRKPVVYPWTPRMLKTYLEYAKTRLTVLATTPCEGPGWGQEWLFEVRDRSHPAAAVFPTLPGIDSAFAHATMTGEMHDRDRAMAEFKELIALLPGVAQAELALGHLLVQTGRFREGYPLVRAASEAGLATCGEPGPLDWALSAYMTGRRKEGVDVYRRALAIYLRWAASPIPLLHRLL